MSQRGVVIDTVTGAIKRKVSGDPAMFALQVGPGESLFALADDDGSFIDDALVVVDGAGNWSGGTAPGAVLEYVAT